MPKYRFEISTPEIDSSAYVAPTAVQIGDIVLKKDKLKKISDNHKFELVASC